MCIRVSDCWFPCLLVESFSMFWFLLCIYLNFLVEPFFSGKFEGPKTAPPNSSPALCLTSQVVQWFSNTKTISGFPEIQSWGINFFLCLSSTSSGLCWFLFFFFFSKSQILPWFKYWKFNLVHTHLPVTNWSNHLIKFQSFQRWNKAENGEFFILFILLN